MTQKEAGSTTAVKMYANTNGYFDHIHRVMIKKWKTAASNVYDEMIEDIKRKAGWKPEVATATQAEM